MGGVNPGLSFGVAADGPDTLVVRKDIKDVGSIRWSGCKERRTKR